MRNADIIARWRDNLDRCLRCGLCREVCPAFRARREERFSPRGRLALLEAALDGGDFGAALRETFDYCLACRACAERCPSGVAGDVLVLAARAASLCRGGFPFFKSWAYRLALGSPRLLASLSALLWLAQKARALPLLLWTMGLPPRLALPALARHPFDAGAPASYPPRGDRKGRVLYFAGCGTNYLYPDAARAVVELLTDAGYEVVVPRARRCCGIPALAAGDAVLARRLAGVNVAALAGEDLVVVDCGSCGEMLAYYYSEVLDVAGAAALRGRVRDFTQVISPRDVTRHREARVAYHDSCHLSRGLGVRAEPRALLGAGGVVAEIAAGGAVRCCGGAGAYGLSHGDVFGVVGGERAAAIAAAGADVVAAGCPACVFYLNEALRRAGSPLVARHTAEILAGDAGGDNRAD